MDSQTLSQTTILYALSTLSQTCAALVAFLGAVALYQLGVLWGRNEETRTQLEQARDIRSVSNTLRRTPGVNFLSTGEDEFTDAQALTKIQELQRYLDEGIAPRARRSQRLFLLFLGVNLAVILVSFVGFPFVSTLATYPKTTYTLLVLSVLLVALSTLAMVLEMMGLLENHIPPWLRKSLDRPYKSQRKRAAPPAPQK